MNVDKAIVDVFKNKLFNSLCKRYGGGDFEDLKSEVMVIVCEMPMEKKIKIVDNGYLLPYCLQILRFQGIGYKNNKFKREFRNKREVRDTVGRGTSEKFSSEWKDQQLIDNEYDILKDQTDDKIIERINSDSMNQSNEFFFHSRLLIETTKYKNIKKTAKAIGIPYNTVRSNLKEYIKQLAEWSKAQQ